MENFNKNCAPVRVFQPTKDTTKFVENLTPILCKICIQIELEKSIEVFKYLM